MVCSSCSPGAPCEDARPVGPLPAAKLIGQAIATLRTMPGRWSGARRPIATATVVIVVLAAVAFITQGRTGLPSSATCEGAQPGGVRFRSALPAAPPSPAAGGAEEARAPRDGDVRPAFRP